MEQLYKRLSNLLSVKSIVTVLLTVAFIILSFKGQMTQEFMTVYTVVIAFYFGTQAKKESVDSTSTQENKEG